MSSSISPTFISRLGVFATNVGYMFADVAHGLVDSYLLCGGEEPTINVASGRSPTSGAKTVRTFQDVWQRCTRVHGERTMNIIFFVFVLSIAIAFLYVIIGLVNIFKSPSTKKKVGVTPPKKKGTSSVPHSSSKSKTESNDANGQESGEAGPHLSESSSSSPSSSPLGPESTSKRDAIATITSSDTYRFAKALIDESAECSKAIVSPTPSSQLFASSSSPSSTVIKASNKVAFPSKVGVMLTSPCQQYWLISCRATLEARVYPQNHKPQFLTKGQDLSKKLYLGLGYLIGPVVGSTTTAVGSKTCPAVDISIASFLSSTPLSSLQFSSTDDSRGGAQGQSSQQQQQQQQYSSPLADPLLNDTSSTYLAVGESQKDTFVILRLTTSTTPISAAGTMEDSSPVNDSRSEGTRHAAGKMLFAHYKTTPVRAEVLWLYRRSTNRLVWDTYRFGLFSSFSCAPTARITSASCGVESSRRGCIFGAGAGAEDSLLMSEADQHMYSNVGGSSSSSSTLATIADILVFANSDDTSVEMIHRTHVGDGYDHTPWGSYKSEKEKTSSSSAAKGNSGKKGAAKGADTSNATNVNNPVRTVLAEADTDWHPQHLKAGQSYATRNKNTNKFSVGQCTAMQLSDPLILCCGAFTTEPTLSQLTLPRYPLATGSAGPSTVKELLQTYAIDRLFPSEAMRPKGHSSHHASSLATSAASIPSQRLRIPRVVPAYFSELSGLVGSVLKSTSSSSTTAAASSSFSLPTEELLARFIHQSSTSVSSASASFTRSGFAVQQVAVINPFQPASTLSYNSGSGHRPCICVVFCDNGCGFVYDLASYWESGNVLSAGSNNSTTSDEMLRSYAVYSGVDSPSSSGKSSSLPPVTPPRRAADKPIATFFDLAFARKEVKVSSSASSAPKETVVIGGCDLMSVCVTGAGPRYGLRIALVNKARRAVSIYGTCLAPQRDGKGGRGVSYVDAPLTDGLVKFLIEEGQTNEKAQRRSASDIVSFATSQKNLPANTNAVPYTDAFSCAPSAETGVLPALAQWTALHPALNKYGESNSIEHLCFIQNGLGVATVGKEDGLGILMHSLP